MFLLFYFLAITSARLLPTFGSCCHCSNILKRLIPSVSFQKKTSVMNCTTSRWRLSLGIRSLPNSWVDVFLLQRSCPQMLVATLKIPTLMTVIFSRLLSEDWTVLLLIYIQNIHMCVWAFLDLTACPFQHRIIRLYLYAKRKMWHIVDFVPWSVCVSVGHEMSCAKMAKPVKMPFGIWIGTNLIHDFTAITFSMKLAFFREKCLFPWNP